MVRAMSTFLLTLLGLTASASYPCAVRREIAPCTCRLQEPKLTTIVVACEQMPSFTHIVDVLHNRFPPEQDISLKISFSRLDDLRSKSFKELGMSVSNLNLNFDDLSYLEETSFVGLEGVEYLSLADNRLVEIPRNVLARLPKIKTLDLGRSRISALLNDDFTGLPTLMHLMLPGNAISRIDTHALPRTMLRIHLARNNLRHLNQSLRALTDLEWLFINGNQLSSLQEELPPHADKLILIHAANNQLSSLPQELRNYPAMDTLFFNNNDIESLDGALQRARKLKRLHLTHNRIHTLADDEFGECELMDDIELGHNHLRALSGAFAPMKRLRTLNLTHNHLHEFSIQEIRGLQNLKVIDLSHNRIQRLTGHIGNLVELETRVEELRLEHNELTALEGALLGIHGLRILSVHNNKLHNIAPDDLIGLDDLRILDVSFNYLKTLEETSKTFLPRLKVLYATHNHLTVLGNDFHGLPVLCTADLSHNQIHSIGPELGSNSHCNGTAPLIVTLHNNPAVCLPDFYKTIEYLKGNMTLLQADSSVCPPPTTTTTSTTPQPTTTSTSLPPMPPLAPIDVVTLLRSQPAPPQVIPLLYSPDLLLPASEKTENAVVEAAQIVSPPQNVTTPTVTPPNNSNNTNHTSPTPQPQQLLRHPLVLFKDEGQNVTLVIPMANGVINKDHGVEQYTQSVATAAAAPPAAITNIEIVDINPLPQP